MTAGLKRKKELTYPQYVALGYLAIILTGTLLLLLPVSSTEPTGFLTALFTATSATCVTGLITVATATHWTLFGQIVIIVLIQIGGLGFMTVMTMFSFMLSRRIGLRARGRLSESVSTAHIGGIVRLMKRILIGTAVIELAGAALLAIRFIPQFGTGTGIYYAVFHSISAFCNAGFDLMAAHGQSSLMAYAGDPLVTLTVAALILVGGIGFFVWDDVVKNKWHLRHYSFHSKIALSVTAILTLVGSVLFFFGEADASMEGMSVGERVLASLFAAVTPRTAGFNTVDMAALSPTGQLLTILLMFIGGSPGSTAGGLKTTTLAVLVVSALSSIRRGGREGFFGRRFEAEALRRAASVLVVHLTLTLTGVTVLSLCEAQPLADITIESISAISTVGLTTGITPSLGAVSQSVLAFLMYCGRVGSLSFALLLTDEKAQHGTALPAEKVNIG